MLDPELFRRFDDVTEFSLSEDALVRRLPQNRLSVFSTAPLDLTTIGTAATALNHAAIVLAAEDAAMEMVLTDPITTEPLLCTFSERRAGR